MNFNFKLAVLCIAALAFLLVGSGCGSGGETEVAAPATAPPIEQPSSDTASDEPAGDFEPVRTAAYGGELVDEGSSDESALNGATFAATVEVGEVFTDPSTTLPSEFKEILDECPDGWDAGIAIPVKTRIENTSDVALSLALDIGGGGALSPTMDVGMSTDDGPECDFNSKGQAYYSDLAAGDTGSNNFLVVIPEYFSDRFPDGQPNALRNKHVSFMVSELTDDGRTYSSSYEQTCYSEDFEGLTVALTEASTGSSYLPRIPLTDIAEDAEPGAEDFLSNIEKCSG